MIKYAISNAGIKYATPNAGNVICFFEVDCKGKFPKYIMYFALLDWTEGIKNGISGEGEGHMAHHYM